MRDFKRVPVYLVQVFKFCWETFRSFSSGAGGGAAGELADIRNDPRIMDRWISEISACHYATCFVLRLVKYTASSVWQFNV